MKPKIHNLFSLSLCSLAAFLMIPNQAFSQETNAIDTIENKLNELISPLTDDSTKPIYLFELKRINIQENIANPLSALIDLENEISKKTPLNQFLASDLKKLSVIFSKPRTEILLDELFNNTNELPYFCNRLTQNQNIETCKNTIRGVFKIIENLNKENIVFFNVQGESTGEFKFLSLYLQSSTNPTEYLNIFFDLFHEVI